jgi:hypothetical protein
MLRHPVTSVSIEIQESFHFADALADNVGNVMSAHAIR